MLIFLPFSLVCVNQGDEQIRLADDAFAKVCHMINDPSMKVRKEAAALLVRILIYCYCKLNYF